MRQKVSFSSVLREHAGYEHSNINSQSWPSLSSLAQQYFCNPNADFTLKLAHNKKRHNTSRSNLAEIDFEQGCNPLEQWINNQTYASQNVYNNRNLNYNKQNNLNNAQHTKKQSLQEILKSKSPRKNNQKIPLRQEKHQRQMSSTSKRNLSMNQLSKRYVQQKNFYQNYEQQEEPVWKFCSKESETEYREHHRPLVSKNNFYQRPIQNNQRYQEQKYEHQELIKPQNPNRHRQQEQVRQQNAESNREVDKTNVTPMVKIPKVNTQPQQEFNSPNFYHKESLDQNQDKKEASNLSDLVSKIKDDLSSQIQAMAERIISERKNADKSKDQDQPMLISQRQIENQKKILSQAKTQIQEYLKTKRDFPSFNKEQGSIKNLPTQSAVTKIESKNVSFNIKSENSNANNSNAVGYSFANDNNVPTSAPEEKKEQQVKTYSNIVLHKRQFSLPNIDEVKSEHDVMDNSQFQHHQFTNKNKQIKSQIPIPEIDNKVIQEIQSVAYNTSKNVTQSFKDKSVEKQQTQGRPSLHQRVAKLSMSMSMGHEKVEEVEEEIAVKSSLHDEKQQKSIQDSIGYRKKKQQSLQQQIQNFVKKQQEVAISSTNNQHKGPFSYNYQASKFSMKKDQQQPKQTSISENHQVDDFSINQNYAINIKKVNQKQPIDSISNIPNTISQIRIEQSKPNHPVAVSIKNHSTQKIDEIQNKNSSIRNSGGNGTPKTKLKLTISPKYGKQVQNSFKVQGNVNQFNEKTHQIDIKDNIKEQELKIQPLKQSITENQTKKSINNANSSFHKIKISSYVSATNSIKQIKPLESHIVNEIKNKEPMIKMDAKSSIKVVQASKNSFKGPKQSLKDDQFQFQLDF